MTNPLFRQKWIDKAGSVREVILQLDLEEDVVLDGYLNEAFVDGSSKHPIFFRDSRRCAEQFHGAIPG